MFKLKRFSFVVFLLLMVTIVWAGDYATNPNPNNGATNVDVNSNLSWSAGDNTISHDVYFGTDQSEVANAQRLAGDINGDGSVNIDDLAILAGQWLTNPGAVNPSADIAYNQYVDMDDFAAVAADWGQDAVAEFQGNQTAATFDPGTLQEGVTYYWRVDEINASNPASPWVGSVWSFTTGTVPGPATGPSPANGATDISVDTDLSWTAGAGATSHNVYFGTSSPGTSQGNQAGTTFDTGTMTENTTYYWRIDEVNAYGTTTGTVWSFTTSSAIINAVGYWTMDDNASNSTVLDSTANNYHGTFIDSTNPNTSYHHSSDCQEGTGSLIFDGSDDYVTLPRNTVLETGNASTKQLSACAWIKTNATSPEFGTILGTGDGGWVLARQNSGMITGFWFVSPAQLVIIQDSTNISDGQWHHVAVVYNGSLVSLYIDGVAKSSSASGGTIDNLSNKGVLIGENAGANGRYWNGSIDDVKIFDYALSAEEINDMQDSNRAWNPSPANGAGSIPVDADLSWTAGEGATSHDVYFGTSSPGAFQRNQSETTFNPGTLSFNTTYYWRIDEINAGSTTTGTIWSFTTESGGSVPDAASGPSPANGATSVSVNTDLSWTAGTGATSHDVYFGTSSPGAFQGNQSETTFDPGTLSFNTTYYWRIDEVNTDGSTTGTVWSFATQSDIAPPNASYSFSDTWVAVDALGRALPDYDDCGAPRSGRYAAMFYSLWLGEHGTGGPYDITQILAANPYDPAWGPGDYYPNSGAPHHWGQSELGYYLSSDQWVMRKHAYLLANADIDVVVIDITNAFTYYNNYMALCGVFSAIRAEGGTTPQIAFMANAFADQAVQSIYDNLYGPGHYSDLWFYWKGKPLVLAPLNGMEVGGRTITYSSTVLNFFNMRYSWAWTSGQDIWNWIDDYPQDYGWHESSSIPESVSVCAGHHANSNKGRSYHSGSQPSHDEYALTGTEHQGLNFAEQWNRLNQIDPELVFITQWNEWTQERYIVPAGQQFWFLGNLVGSGATFFVDSYSQEYSRDIEPMKGGHTDNYYYQMIGGIRRYKGVRQLPAASAAKTISIDGGFSDWVSVGPEYIDWLGDTMHRNSAGWGSAGPYINTTGRNDFLGAKVARNDTYIYFYIRTDVNITSYTGSNWMMLFINSDQNYSNGWEGYDYVVNMGVNSSTSTTLKGTSGGWNWTNVNTNIAYRVSGNQMEIRVPRSDIGQGSGSDPVALDFKWSDNIQNNDDIIEFAISGDSAPDRRFNYRYDTSITNTIDITNPSFESPNVSGYLYDPSGSGWTPNKTGQMAFADSGSAFGNTSYNGSQIMVMQRDVSASQAISGFQVGKIYKVTWAEADRYDPLGGNTLRVLIDGNVVGALHTVTNDSWVVQTSSTFTATSTTHTLTFDATNAQGGDRSVFIDAVSITEVP